MKRLILVAGILVIAFLVSREPEHIPEPATTAELRSAGSEAALIAAYQSRRSDVQIRGAGEVVRILPDDKDGSRHQRFILRTAAGQTVLVAHNIDLAPRVKNLQVGDHVEFYGEYEWNDKGGVIHWTHRDPRGKHVGGWIRHGERTYD